MTRPSDQFTQVLGHNTRFWQLGTQGSTVVLIHGISCSVLEWEHVIHTLAKHHQVYALDLLGHGLTDKPIDQPYDMAMFGAFVFGFMDALNLKSASLIGNSLGARIAMECAALSPSRVEAILLSAPAAIDNPTLFDFRLASVPLLGELLTRPTMFGTGKIWKSAFVNTNYASQTMIAEKVALAKLPGAGVVFLKALRSMLRFGGFRGSALLDSREKAALIKAPTLVVWGQQDRFLPVSHMPTLMRWIPNAQPVVLDPCGHVPMIECAAEFSRICLEFLRKVPR
jgi:pimeloyl-ACP methyl ester carboxylesterase